MVEIKIEEKTQEKNKIEEISLDIKDESYQLIKEK